MPKGYELVPLTAEDRKIMESGGIGLSGDWQRLNAPLVNIPKITEEEDDDTLTRYAKRGANVVGDFVSGMTSPMSLGSLALTAGGALAGRAGLFGISQAARTAEAAMSIPSIAHGAYMTGTAKSLPEAAGGLLEAGLGAYGATSGLSTEGFTPVRYGKQEVFDRALRANASGESLTGSAPEALYQRRSGAPVYYGVNATDAGERDLTSVMNNSTQRGVLAGIMADADKRGVTTLDAWAVPSEKMPDGMLPTLYRRYGWEEVSRQPYDMKYGEPSDELKRAWSQQGWAEGDPIPDVVYMRRAKGATGDAAQSPRTSAQSEPMPAQASQLDAPDAISPAYSTTPPAVPRSALSSTAMALAGPAATLGIPDDPDSELDDYARLALIGGSGASLATAGWFPKRLASKINKEVSEAKAAQRAAYFELEPTAKKDSFKADQAALRQIVRDNVAAVTDNPALQQKLADGYATIALPVANNINYDLRRPTEALFESDKIGTSSTTSLRKARGVKFNNFAKRRLDFAYDEGVKRAATERWGNNEWLYHLSDGDPEVAVRVVRLLGAFSPGQVTDLNTLNAMEGFLRASMGETPEMMLGKKVFNPDTKKWVRGKGSMSMGHPRPGTVEGNLTRAMELGRIFQTKVEALASAELGVASDIPIDMWLMRAIGAQSDRTPSDQLYRLIAESMSKQAKEKGEEPFAYMAKVWMGMQKIAGTPSASFETTAANMALTKNLGNPANYPDLLAQIESREPLKRLLESRPPKSPKGKKGKKSREDAIAADAAESLMDEDKYAAKTVVSSLNPNALNPKDMNPNPTRSYEEWNAQARALLDAGKSKDVLKPKWRPPTPADVVYEPLRSAENPYGYARTVTAAEKKADKRGRATLASLVKPRR